MSTEFSETVCDALSEIYAIRDIDIRTVRPIAPVEVEEEYVPQPKSIPRSALQMPLFAEDSYREVMPSFILSEPIHVLGLSTNIEAYLHGRGITTIQELIEGNIDHAEAKEKVTAYINGRPLHESETINYSAWLRAVLGAVPILKAYVTLEFYRLEKLYPLSAAQKIELRRLDNATKKQLASQMWHEWRESGAFTRFHATAERVSHVLVRPWMRKRQGLAAGYELRERLERLGEDGANACQVISCFQEQFCGGNFPLERTLCHADHDLYADTLDTARLYDHLVELVMTYFYRDTLVYDFQQLVSLVQRELAKQWGHLDPSFTVRALRLSPQFSVRKGPTHTLQIRLA